MSQQNQPARPGPYTDVSITRRNPPARTITPTPAYNANSTGQVAAYDVPEVDHTPDNGSAPAQPHAPASWKPGRDLYANNGAAGQSQFNNAVG